MYCPKCGKENPNEARFCAGCGAPLMQPGARQAQTGTHAQTGEATQAGPRVRQAQAGASAQETGSQLGSQLQDGFRQAASYAQTVGDNVVRAGQVSLVVTIVGAIMLVLADLLPLITISGWGMKESYTYLNLSKLLATLDQPGGTGVLFKVIGILWIVLAAAIAYLKVQGRRTQGIVVSIVALVLMIFVRVDLGSTAQSVFGISIAVGSSMTITTIGVIVALAGSILQN